MFDSLTVVDKIVFFVVGFVLWGLLMFLAVVWGEKSDNDDNDDNDDIGPLMFA